MGKYRRNRQREDDNKHEGILLLDKPSGVTSHDVVDEVRRKLGMRRVGHGGTLDPLATGLLIVLVGKATTLFQRFSDYDKIYESVMRLGAETSTGDSEGEVVKTGNPEQVTEEAIRAVFSRFKGELLQTPPMVSALRHKGKRLYELAREGKEVSVPPRRITVYENEIMNIDMPSIAFRVRCSKGTYVRKLAQDIGEELGCYGHITAIRRTAIGPFALDKAITIDQVDAQHLVPAETVRSMLADNV
jgi:tRNA pseudouridine55 synthase